jgi:predicted branched-subunit amino acid permease
MKKTKIDSARLVEVFGYAGIGLVLLAFFVYLFYPLWRESTWVMNLYFGIIGTSLILTAIILHFKKIKS